jgi:hypothetical protein
MLPQAEMSTAGVIIAVSTVIAEDKGFIVFPSIYRDYFR